jgi:uncharacterized membrane protein YjfL (UPF0719 family)
MTTTTLLVRVTEETFGSTVWNGVGAILSYAAIGLALLVVGYYAVDITTPGHLSKIIRTERNPNASLLAASAMLAVGLIVTAAILGSSGRLLHGVVSTAVFGIIGVAAQLIASFIFDLLVRVEINDLLHQPVLQPATWMLATTRVVIGLVIAVAVV